MALIARSVVAELLAARSPHMPGRISPLGGTHTLTSDGLPNSVPISSQSKAVVELQQAEPRSWNISLQGVAPLVNFGTADTFPFAKWIVQWGQQANALTTEVDAYSDQYLTVYGNFVRVALEWDVVQYGKLVAAFPLAGLRLPTLLRGAAAISPSEGSVTRARRTVVLAAQPLPELFAVPFVASSAIVRAPDAAQKMLGATLLWSATGSGTTTIDRWLPVTLAQLHLTQTPGAIPSLANFVLVDTAALVPPAFGFLEFVLEP